MNLRRTCGPPIFVLMVFAATATSAIAAEPAEKPEGEASKMNVARFGELPVRFNGRVTTVSHVAPIILKQLSDRDFVEDADGRRQSAVSWLLDFVAGDGKPQDVPLIPINNMKLLLMLELEDDARVRRYRDQAEKAEGDAVDPPRFAVAELQPKFELLERESKRLGPQVDPKSYSDLDHAILDLKGRIQSFITMTVLHRFPLLTDQDAVNVETIRRLIGGLKRFEPYAQFRMIPASDDRGKWHTVLRADILLRASEAAGADSAPAARSLRAICDAYREKDAAKFDRHLGSYLDWVKTSGARESPFSFTVPDTWREAGVPLGAGDKMFMSVLANGDTVAEFDIGEDTQYIKAFVRHFTGKTMPDSQIINDWRIGFGLMPLADAELAKTGTPITVAGKQARYFDLSPSPQVESIYKRTLNAVVRQGEHTFLINVGLPEKVTHEVQTFEAFVKSLHFGSSEQLSRWFADSQPMEQVGFQTTAVALVPDGMRLWSFEFAEFVPAIKEHSQMDALETMLKSIRSLEGNPKAGIQWTLPEGWRQGGPGNQPTIYYLESKLASAQLMVYAIGDAAGADRLPLVNLWRIQSGLPAWKDGQMKEATRELRVRGRPIELIQFEVRPIQAANEADGKEAHRGPIAEKFSYELPEGWVATKGNAFALAAFQIQDRDQQASVTVTELPRPKAPDEARFLGANINRWRAQLDLPALDEAKLRESVKEIPVGDQKGRYVDFTGKDGKRIIGAIVPRGESVWFLKVHGRQRLLGQHKTRFEQFAKSFRFRSGESAE